MRRKEEAGGTGAKVTKLWIRPLPPLPFLSLLLFSSHPDPGPEGRGKGKSWSAWSPKLPILSSTLLKFGGGGGGGKPDSERGLSFSVCARKSHVECERTGPHAAP